jgi:hypothetical protein
MRTIQPHITKTSEAAFDLVRREIPSIIETTIEKYNEKQEAEKKRIAAQLGYIVEADGTMRSRVPPIRSFLAKNAVSLTLFVVLALILAPELMRWGVSHIPLFRWMAGG